MEPKKKEIVKPKKEDNHNPACGIIMPISSIDECTTDHWKEVLSILKDSITLAGFEPALVSDSDDVGIIQRNIIHNIYYNPIVVCDVSSKNPNVMFELGMRLAFDKPTIIVKDDKTAYSFDTSPIEHLEYPRDLQYFKIIEFKESLTEKIKATHTKAKGDKQYSTFLKHFGEFKIAQIPESEVSSENYLLQAMDDLRMDLKQVIRNTRRPNVEQGGLFEDTPYSYKQAMDLVFHYIEKYLKEKGIADITLLKSDDLELITYLSKFSEIRKACRSQEVLKTILVRILG